MIISTDPGQMAGVANRFDLIVDTVSYARNPNPLSPNPSTYGTFVLLGFMEPLDPAANAGTLVFGHKTIAAVSVSERSGEARIQITPINYGIRSTGLITAPVLESSAARLISASG